MFVSSLVNNFGRNDLKIIQNKGQSFVCGFHEFSMWPFFSHTEIIQFANHFTPEDVNAMCTTRLLMTVFVDMPFFATKVNELNVRKPNALASISIQICFTISGGK